MNGIIDPLDPPIVTWSHHDSWIIPSQLTAKDDQRDGELCAEFSGGVSMVDDSSTFPALLFIELDVAADCGTGGGAFDDDAMPARRLAN